MRFSYSKPIDFIVKSVFLNKLHWLSWLMWLVFILPAQAIELRVAIEKEAAKVKIGSSTTAIVKDASGKQLGELSPRSSLLAKLQGNKIAINRLAAQELIVEPQDDGYVWIGDRWYRGRTRLILQNDGITAINHVELEEYLYSVVGAEAVSSWPIEALKAQAVAARSYALYKRNTTKPDSIYDLDTTVGTQVYKGLDSEYTTTHQAVNDTLGQIMTYDNRVILAAFHSSSGGYTENVEDVWKSPLPYLRAVVDYDHESPVFEWQQVIPVSKIRTLVAGVGNIRGLQPVRMTPRGRVIPMKVMGDRGTATVSGKQLRQVLNLRSTLFRVSTDGNSLKVKGRGFGHGLGLSQWGAYYLAKKGVNYHQILAHYYQNANLSQLER